MKISIYIKILAKSIFQQLFLIPAAAIYYKTRIKKKGVYNLIICGHIGDFLYAMGYRKAFQKENQISRLRVVGIKKFQELAQLYGGFEYRAVSAWWLHILCIANRYVLGQKLFQDWQDNCVVEPANGFVQGFDFAKCFPALNLKDCIRYGAFRLAADSSFELPRQPAGILCRQKPKSDSSPAQSDACIRKILLCPSAQTLSYERTEQLFTKLAAALKAQHYEVCANAENGRNNHANLISCGLKELYEGFCQYEAVIGIRSGVLDLAASAGCRVIALYPPACDLAVFYDLRHFGRQVCQYQLTGGLEEDVNAVMQKLKEVSENECSIHHRTGRRQGHAYEGIDA